MSCARRSRFVAGTEKKKKKLRLPSILRYSRSPSPEYCRSMSRSRSPPGDVGNPGNNLYVTGLSRRTSVRDIEKHFSAEGEVVDVHLVTDPRTRKSCSYGFVTMSRVEEADRCFKYLDGSVLRGRVITVVKARRRRGRTPTARRRRGCTPTARRRRGRTPTPGRYLGHARRRMPRCSRYRRSLSSTSESDWSQSSSRSSSGSPRRRKLDSSYSPYKAVAVMEADPTLVLDRRLLMAGVTGPTLLTKPGDMPPVTVMGEGAVTGVTRPMTATTRGGRVMI